MSSRIKWVNIVHSMIYSNLSYRQPTPRNSWSYRRRVRRSWCLSTLRIPRGQVCQLKQIDDWNNYRIQEWNRFASSLINGRESGTQISTTTTSMLRYDNSTASIEYRFILKISCYDTKIYHCLRCSSSMIIEPSSCSKTEHRSDIILDIDIRAWMISSHRSFYELCHCRHSRQKISS